MNLKFKEGYSDALIYLPIERRDVICKFIDPRLYPYLYSKYPDFFEEIKDTKKNSKNDLPINNSINKGNNNNSTEQTELSI